MRRGRRAALRVRTEALLVGRSVVGEADLLVSLLTEERGVVSAIARGARLSTKRFAGLEPMHGLWVGLDLRGGVDLATLAEASIARPRTYLTSGLERLEAAGRFLRWLRRAAPMHTPDPDLWREANTLLDALDDEAAAADPLGRLAESGLRFLVTLGVGLELERCVRCGRPCGPEHSACVDAARGGLVCRACGGARTILRPDRRAKFVAAIQGGGARLEGADALVALDLVEIALSAHAGAGP